MPTPEEHRTVDLDAVATAHRAWRAATVAHQMYLRDIEQGFKTPGPEFDALCRDLRATHHFYRESCRSFVQPD